MSTLDRLLQTNVGKLDMREILELLAVVGNRTFYLPDLDEDEKERVNEILDDVEYRHGV
jgi:hypothetical protein